MIQVSVEKSKNRKVKLNKINAFFKKMSDLTISQIEFKYCPLPHLASTAKVSFASDVPSDKKFKWDILKFPVLYCD